MFAILMCLVLFIIMYLDHLKFCGVCVLMVEDIYCL